MMIFPSIQFFKGKTICFFLPYNLYIEVKGNNFAGGDRERERGGEREPSLQQ